MGKKTAWQVENRPIAEGREAISTVSDAPEPAGGYSVAVAEDALPQPSPSEVALALKALFSLGENTTFAVSINNPFSTSLAGIIEAQGAAALSAIEQMILNEATSISLAAETLDCIGNIESATHRIERRRLLETCLNKSRFVWVRDAAAVGLSAMDDPRSIAVLQQAIDREEHHELKADMLQILEQLEATA